MGHILLARAVVFLLLAAGCSRPAPDAGQPVAAPAVSDIPADLYMAPDAAAVVKAARVLMETDTNVALTTLDEAGQPRVRTVNARLKDVDPSDPQKTTTVWILTRASTRKVDQIRKHPKVTLYFNDDPKIVYLSLMGTAIIHDDPADPAVQPFLDDETRKFFWPGFPKEFMVIEVRPRWLEYLSEALPGHAERWTPQAVVFDK